MAINSAQESNSRGTAEQVVKALVALHNPAVGRFLARFFKTGKGQYAEGDKFLGIKVPVTRSIAKAFANLPVQETRLLLLSQWHEARLAALLIWTSQFPHASGSDQRQIRVAYFQSMGRINNWDLVDASAPTIVGPMMTSLEDFPLSQLLKSQDLWKRRIAMVGSLSLIRQNKFALPLQIARRLIDDKRDLIQKAVGWMLREIGKRDRTTLSAFLSEFAAIMPRTALRYAIEHYSPVERKEWLDARRKRMDAQAQAHTQDVHLLRF